MFSGSIPDRSCRDLMAFYVLFLDGFRAYMNIRTRYSIISAAYIEYRIDNFGLKKHLPESVKKPILRIKSIFRNRKNILRIFYYPFLLGFTPIFDMETSLFLWYLLWLCLCTPKFYPKYFYPKYSKYCFFSDHTRGVEIRYILSRRPGLYIDMLYIQI